MSIDMAIQRDREYEGELYGRQTADGTFEYTHEQVGVAASLALYAKKENAFLVITRKKNPYKGQLAFPGGYIETDKETIRGAAVREALEETGVSVSADDLYLIDVRSEPARDPKQHVVDIGFLSIIDEVIEPRETSEATPVWMSVDELKHADLAFDHSSFFAAAYKRAAEICA